MTRARLLVLDDDPTIGAFVAFTMTHAFNVAAVSSADAFFDRVLDWKPSCVMIDLDMPEVDGVQVLRTLADRQFRVPVLIMSSVEDKVLEAARRSADERGLHVLGAISKPLSSERLKAMLKRATAADWLPRPQPVTVSESVLAHALENSQLTLHYQPKVRIADGEVIGFEALARWTHPTLGEVAPSQFIPLAERSGLIDLLTWQTVEIAFAWFGGAPYLSGKKLSLNLSAEILHDRKLPDRMHDRCLAHGVRPGNVVLELTETGSMRDLATALENLTRLRIKGFDLAIDDFGTGYSSMVQLARLPLSWIKIDQSFVSAMSTNPRAFTMVESTARLAAALGMFAVAEGVEDARTLQMLQQLGCDGAQGYFFAAPMPAAEIERWLATRHRPLALVG